MQSTKRMKTGGKREEIRVEFVWKERWTRARCLRKSSWAEIWSASLCNLLRERGEEKRSPWKQHLTTSATHSHFSLASLSLLILSSPHWFSCVRSRKNVRRCCFWIYFSLSLSLSPFFPFHSNAWLGDLFLVWPHDTRFFLTALFTSSREGIVIPRMCGSGVVALLISLPFTLFWLALPWCNIFMRAHTQLPDVISSLLHAFIIACCFQNSSSGACQKRMVGK